MTYDVARWEADNVLTMKQHPRGIRVLEVQALAHEKAAVEAAVEKAIRDCIAAVEKRINTCTDICCSGEGNLVGNRTYRVVADDLRRLLKEKP